MHRISRFLLIAALAAVSLPCLGAVRGTVAVVPTVNGSGEKWAEFKQRQSAMIDDWAVTHLPAAGYALTPRDDVRSAVRALALDMTDEENWRRSVVLEIGRKAGADFVLFCAITSTEQKLQKRPFYEDKEGRTDVRVWLMDTRSGEALLTGKTFTGRSGGNRVSIDNKGSERQIQAAANAVRDATRDFLAPYKAK